MKDSWGCCPEYNKLVDMVEIFLLPKGYQRGETEYDCVGTVTFFRTAEIEIWIQDISVTKPIKVKDIKSDYMICFYAGGEDIVKELRTYLSKNDIYCFSDLQDRVYSHI